MNLFSDYQKKILILLKKLERKKIINLPKNLKSFTVEIPPNIFDADMSCNAAMILAKINKKAPSEFAEILKKHFLNNFSEFETINIAKPGFININFKNNFWKMHLLNIIFLKIVIFYFQYMI